MVKDISSDNTKVMMDNQLQQQYYYIPNSHQQYLPQPQYSYIYPNQLGFNPLNGPIQYYNY